MLTLVLGGVRSGKSRYAEQCAKDSGKQVVYIATATITDNEMQSRIEQHRIRRSSDWLIIEEPVHLADVIQRFSDNNFLLVDCLTLWLSNIMFDNKGELQESTFDLQTAALLKVLENTHKEITLVTNEIGLGVVSADKKTRRFVDESGLLHQRISQLADRVVLMTAGLPQILK